MSKRIDKEESVILESGEIGFFYRPKVERESAKGLRDVQNTYLVLHPDDKDQYRILVLGKKRLPRSKRGGSKVWGFVEDTKHTSKTLRESLSGQTYQTKTRGERHVEPARLAGEGRYKVVRHEDHTHLAYELDEPREPNTVQKGLRIRDQESLIIAVNNPGRGPVGSRPVPEHDDPKLSGRLKGRFGGRRWAPADPPQFLDTKDVEFTLLHASKDPCQELDIGFKKQQKGIRKRMGLRKRSDQTKPMQTGQWY